MIRIYTNGASGKMGQSLSKLIESDDQFQSVSENDFSLSDVVVDFSNPISTLKILKRCLEINTPIVIGTTGFNDDEINEIKNAGSKIPILLAANFSLGVSSLKESLEYFIKTLDQDMRCLIEETHHIEKLDQPSGTAIELKNLIDSIDKNNNIKTIKIKSVRKKDVFGLHKVTFHNQNKTSYFMHEALSREVFAKGALFSSNAIMKMKPKVYNFKDILN
jgi:4-hydroxy-tetrahydrodipicolinate reductase